MSIICNTCGKEYSYGRRISFDCCGEVKNFGAIFETRTISHTWNSNFVDHPIIKREIIKSSIHLPMLKIEKNHALVYE